jgi:hypothetical protein
MQRLEEKSSASVRDWTPVVQSIVSHKTNWATLAPSWAKNRAYLSTERGVPTNHWSSWIISAILEENAGQTIEYYDQWNWAVQGPLFFLSMYGLQYAEMFWRTETQVAQLAYVVSHNEWQAIKCNPHFSDSSTLRDSNDKLHKLRLFLNSWLKFLNVFQLRRICVDKQIFHSEEST